VKTKNGNLYKQVVSVTRSYFGPAAERFVVRQIRSHLDKEPDELNKEDLDSLIDWIKLAMALLVDNKKLVDEYAARLSELGNR
jgi:hypothetical protein